MKPKPYVGVTGFHRLSEVGRAIISCTKPRMPEYVMLGFTSSNKRIADPASSGKTSPSLQVLPALLKRVKDAASPGLLPMIHYYTPNLDKLADELLTLFADRGLYWSGLCQALQLNAEWPPLSQLIKLKGRLPELKIVMQLPASVLAGTDEDIAKRAELYASQVDYLLIDPSGGEGKSVDLERSAGLIMALREVMPHTTVGVAGGFSADNVAERVATLAKTLGDTEFCVDAQGKLHSKLLQTSYLDLSKVERYLNQAALAYDACKELNI